MTQSANARPCNCDQALEAEGRAEKAERRMKDALDEANERWRMDFGKIGALELKCDMVTRILCDLVSAPSLTVAQFADPTLERIRLAMLGRTG